MSFYVMVKLMPNSKVRSRLLRDEALKCGHSVAREAKATCPTKQAKFTTHVQSKMHCLEEIWIFKKEGTLDKKPAVCKLCRI